MTRDFTKGMRTAFYAMLLTMGIFFWMATETDNFYMSPEVYGDDAVQLPAELWAFCMMIPASLYLLALYINGRRCWTPYMRIACGFFMSSYFWVFVYSAWPAAGGDLMVIASSVMMLKAAAMTWIDASELLRQWGRSDDAK